MKKIVALALCLVLALSLCATAFAADTYSLINLSDNTTATVTTLSTGKVSDTVTGSRITAAAYDYYIIDGKYYGVAAAGYGTHRLYTNDANPVDLKILDDGAALVTIPYVVSEYAVKDTLVNCGDEVAKATDTTIYKVTNAATGDTAIYTDDNGNAVWATLNGKVLKVSTKNTKATFVDSKAHDFTAIANNVFTAGKLTSVKCKNCDVTAIWASQVPAGYESVAKINVTGKVYGENANAGNTRTSGFWYLSSGTPAAGTTTTAVSSAKTFDAGIAMYVGMSIMAVTGSAVVIGKKKEF